MKKNKENLKTIWKTEETLKSLKTLQEEIQKLIHDYEYVWNIELLNRVDGLGVFSHSLSNFILVSNTIDKINKIKELLKFKKEKIT